MSKQLTTRGTQAESWELFPDVPPLFDARLTNFLNSLWAPTPSDGVFVPGGDLTESDRQYILEIDLPGIDKRDIRIAITGRQITVSGTRPPAQRSGSLRRSTRASGAFAYSVILPTAVDEQHITAKLESGVLRVVLPKADDAVATQIEID